MPAVPEEPPSRAQNCILKLSVLYILPHVDVILNLSEAETLENIQGNKGLLKNKII